LVQQTHAVNVVFAAEYQTNAILTLDRRDYRAVTADMGISPWAVS